MYTDDYYTDNYDKYNQNKFSNVFDILKKSKYLVILCVLIIAISIGFYIYTNYTSYLNSYEYLEEKLENEARKYVEANNIKSNREFYVEAKNLHVTLKNDCSSISGVIVDGENYNAYLSCNNYESMIVDNNNDYIKLNGKEILFLNKGNTYSEAYYENKNNLKVNINGSVGLEEGIYNLEYVVMKYDMIVSRLQRKVIVLENKNIDNFYPTISLLGDEIEYLKLGSSFFDKGVVAKDKDDGIINDIKINGNVNTNTHGEYSLIYTVVNSKGYAASTRRRVVVVRNEKDVVFSSIVAPVTLTNDNVKVILDIYGTNYSHVELPNGETINKSSIEYLVSENGSYSFKIYEKNGVYRLETITVSNIDKEVPKASCIAIIDNKTINISVDAKDKNDISGYSYVIDNKATEYRLSNTYTINSTSKNISVKIKDTASNISNIKCNIKVIGDDMSITPIPSQDFKCNTDVSSYNAILANKVQNAGLKTREGVAAAGIYLSTELGFRIPYWWAGKYERIGLNSSWGCDREIWATDGTGENAQGNIHPYGMDCTGFVKWAFINGGFDSSLIPRSSMGTTKFGNANPKKISFSENSNLVNNIKKGDLVFRPGHIALVVGVDDTRIKIAQSVSAGIKVDLIDKYTGKALTKTSSFTDYILLDEFYTMYGN